MASKAPSGETPRDARLDADHEARREEIRAAATERVRFVRHAPRFYGALCAYFAGDGPPENPPSLATCDCSPISGAVGRFDHDLTPPEQEGLKLAFRLGVEEPERAARLVAGGGDRLSTLFALLERDDGDRREKALALLERGAVSHALRLATCGRRSVQLGCPTMGGGCGYEDNYVPIHCDSPLCPDCASRRTAQNIEKWKGAVKRMARPTFITATVANVEDPVAGREQIVDALGKLRRRTIPFEGTTVRENEDGERVRKRWCWWRDGGVPAERWKVRLVEDGLDDLARRLQKQYVRYEWEDVTGRHQGRAIPFEELCDGGLYGIDVKQVGPGEFNVHAHVLADLAYIPQAALSSVWEDITGDPVIDVRRIYDRGEGSAANALEETVGYAVKAPEFEELEDAVEFVEETKGVPLVHPFGSLHGQADDGAGDLLCARCEVAPPWWEYLGMVEEKRDNMGKAWEEDGDRPPPEEADS